MGRINSPSLLGYCSNRHPGESWAELRAHLSGHLPGVKRLLRGEVPFGLGLWISARAARELREPAALAELRELAREESVFSINGFPYGDFHGEIVKERVYEPDWTCPLRLEHTLELIRIAREVAACTPLRQTELSISTLPLSHFQAMRTPDRMRAAAENLCSAAIELFLASRETGADIHLDLEPEPFCALETSRDVARFFTEFLLPCGVQRMRTALGLPESAATETLLDRIRVCLDACHMAVVFEEPEDALARYAARGIRIGKVQLSSALQVRCERGRTEDGSSVVELLEPFSRDRYLHQVVGNSRFQDLPEALSAWKDQPPSGEFRIHCHVPIHVASRGSLETTRAQLEKLLELHRHRPVARLWEVETYTWDVLPEEWKSATMAEGIASELNWI